MFTTIMYGFINEVTRQPAIAEIPLRSKRSGGKERPTTGPRPKVRRVPRAPRLAGHYRVLADSFKRAAGFY